MMQVEAVKRNKEPRPFPVVLEVGVGLLCIAFTAGFIIAEAVLQTGTGLLIYSLVKGGVALAIARVCFPFHLLHRDEIERIWKIIREGAVNMQMGMFAVNGTLGIALGAYGLYNLVPSALDVVAGVHTQTVTSCTYSVDQVIQKRSGRGALTTYYNHYAMVFEDGSSHTTTLKTVTRGSTDNRLIDSLTSACAQRPAPKMTITYYPFTWTLTDVQLVD
ncbi:MAG: hypothetical protein E7C13_02865 [Actinomyces sp.]|jgi:hypothetical protein|nr:hypothetical protein [Actinomyces sp.]